MQILRRIWHEIRSGENLDSYLTIAATIILLVVDLLDLAKPEWLLSINVAVLTLLAITLLGNRHRLENIQERFEQSPKSVFLEHYPQDFEEILFTAKELWIVGVNLGTTMPRYNRKFEDMIKRKGTIKFLLVDPHGVANTLASDRLSEKIYDPDSHRAIILRSLSIMTLLKEQAPSRVDIRTINYIPSFGFLASDVEKPTGVLYAEHYGYRLGSDKPKFVLRPQDDKWYHLFKDQLYALWNAASEWEYDAQKTKALSMSPIESRKS